MTDHHDDPGAVTDLLIRAEENLADTVSELIAARELMKGRSVSVPFVDDQTIDGRDLSIAITHLEDALLRLRHGAPR